MVTSLNFSYHLLERMFYQTPKHCVRKLWLVVLFINTTKFARGATLNGPAIDESHKKLFPNCGRLPTSKITASRIINSKEANVHYPWVVGVFLYYKGWREGACGGTIITSRSVLSCGHCVCGEDKDRKLPKCRRNIIDNQITDDNKVQITSGDNRQTTKEHMYAMWKLLKDIKPFSNEVDDIRIMYIERTTNGNEDRPRGYLGYYDIAVLRSKLPLYANGDTTRAPICLGALNAIIDHDQNITTVGWGDMYQEYPERDLSIPNQKREPEDTTCTTNRNGPLFHRFKKCDIQFLRDNNWSCKKIPFIKYRRPRNSELPRTPSEVYDFDACEKYFSYTKKVIANTIGNATIKWTKHLGTVDNLVVEGHKETPMNQVMQGFIDCYRKELFESNGWCKVDESPIHHKDHDGWGFCDTSCEGMKTYWKNGGGRSPIVYHEMTWSMKDQHSHFPKMCHSPHCSFTHCKLPYMVCIQSIFPKTSTMRIKYLDEHVKDRLKANFWIEKREAYDLKPEIIDPENIGTQKTAQGDSGTGHWIINTESEPSRAVLVAMTTKGITAISSQVQITTDKKILNFIKKTLIKFEPYIGNHVPWVSEEPPLESH